MARLLEGRRVVVTGGGRGIGKAIATRLIAEGASVLICGRDEAVLKTCAADVGAEFAACDVTSSSSVESLSASVRKKLGGVDGLVNNAGIAHSAKFVDTSEDLWQQTMDVNATGTYRVTRALWDELVKAGNKGRVINVASSAARIGYSYMTAYCASKHAVLGFTRALAFEAAQTGVTVNCICPSWVESEMLDRSLANIHQKTGKSNEVARQMLAAMSPQTRITTPDEVASVAAFLASDQAAGITGQAWNVDGGTVMS